MNRYWSSEEETFLREYYNGENAKEIALKLNRTVSSIWHKASRLGISKSPINIPNLSPSPSLLFILGTILSDGSVHKTKRSNKNGRGAECRIQLIVKNYEYAQAFLNALKKIGLTNSKIYGPYGPYSCQLGSSERYVVSSYSKVFYDWFKRLEIEDIKKIISSNPELAEFFAAGYFYGDGYVYEKEFGKKMISIITTEKENADLLMYALSLIGFHPKFNGPYGPYSQNPKSFDKKPLYFVRLNRFNESEKFIKIAQQCLKEMRKYNERG